tara:strand:- start:2991 stop:3323 length:333 start_codon:yes stop_codon:yes gene_type:complete
MGSIGKNNRNNFLFFRNSTTDMLCIPANKITCVVNEGNTDVAIYYEGDQGDAGSLNLLTTTTEEHKVILAIAEIMVNGRGVVVVADDVDNIYCSSSLDQENAVTAFTISA